MDFFNNDMVPYLPHARTGGSITCCHKDLEQADQERFGAVLPSVTTFQAGQVMVECMKK